MPDAFTDAVKAELMKWQSDKSSMTAAQARALVAAIKGDPEPPKPNLAAVLEKRPASAVPTSEPSELPDTEPTVEVLVASGGPGSPVEENAPRLATFDEIGHRLVEVAQTRAPVAGEAPRYDRAGRRQWRNRHGFDSGVEDNFAVQRDVMRDAQTQARAEVYDGAVLQAASGICGPLQPSYSLLNVASSIDGVIRLPDLEARRGGFRLATSLTFDDLRDAPGVAYPYTSQMGADGGTKPCVTVECPGINDFLVTAYQSCFTFGNFQASFFPEYLAHISDLGEATHAQRVGAALIAAILAGVDTVTYDSNGATKGGDAWNQFVRQATFHAWLYRGRYRTAQDLVLDQVWPYRAKGALIADLMPRDSSTPTVETFRVEAALAELSRAIGVRFQWVYDGLAPSMESLPGDFSNEAYEFLTMPPGAAMHMSGDTLDFGLVRDSTLNSRNEVQLWWETFDGVAFSGLEIMRATEVVLCPTGATGDRVTLPCSGAGS